MSQGPNQVPRDRDDESVTWTTYVTDIVSSATLVLLVGLLLFAVSGVWPPLVAIESGSMHPNVEKADLVFVMDEGRFVPADQQAGTGVVPAAVGAETGYSRFHGPGDVIVFAPDGNDDQTPVIHRAMFWVSVPQNDTVDWTENPDFNPAFTNGKTACGQVTNCPARHSGFITKGDNNTQYDQDSGLSEPVRPEWIMGTAEFRVPRLGCVRLGSCMDMVGL